MPKIKYAPEARTDLIGIKSYIENDLQNPAAGERVLRLITQIWLTQKMSAALYSVDVRTINEHIKKAYYDIELTEESTIRKFRIVQTEGERQVQRNVKYCSLQMIIAEGFKVNNDRAVQFRKTGGGKYWRELFDRIHDIRSLKKSYISRFWI